MDNSTRKLFYGFLVILLAIAPVRGVMAANFSGCEMMVDDASLHSSMTGMDSRMAGHSPMVDQNKTKVPDCCDNKMACNNDCVTGLSVSVITQPAFHIPILHTVNIRTLTHPASIFREQTPPARPPAILHS